MSDPNDTVGCDEDGMCQDKKTVTVQSHYFTTPNKNLGVRMMRREAGILAVEY